MRRSSADIWRKQKKKRRKKRESLGLVQPWIVDVLVLHWSAQSQDLCWGETSSSDQREEP